MLLLKDAITIDPVDRVLEVAQSRPLVVVMSGEGRISLCSPRSGIVILQLCAPTNIWNVCLHPSKPLLGLIERTTGKLLVLRLDGTAVLECPVPQLHAGSPDWVTAGYSGCHFDTTGAYLWSVAAVAKNKIEVQLRETDGWSVVGREVVEHPLDQGSLGFFHPADRAETLALWMADSGGGSCVYWVMRDGNRFRCVLEAAVMDTLPPVFAPSGREFLAIDSPSPIGVMRKFRYPRTKLLTACESPFGEDDPFDYPVRYLDDRFALANTLNNRIALLDTSTLRFVKEIVVEGHEPRPVEEHFPGQAGADGKGLCGDISFDRTGDYLAVFCPLGPLLKQEADGGLMVQERPTRLLFFPISYVLERECA